MIRFVLLLKDYDICREGPPHLAFLKNENPYRPQCGAMHKNADNALRVAARISWPMCAIDTFARWVECGLRSAPATAGLLHPPYEGARDDGDHQNSHQDTCSVYRTAKQFHSTPPLSGGKVRQEWYQERRNEGTKERRNEGTKERRNEGPLTAPASPAPGSSCRLRPAPGYRRDFDPPCRPWLPSAGC